MLDVTLLRDNPEKVKEGIASKNADPKLVDVFLELDGKWREAVTALDAARAFQHELSLERNVEEAKKNKIKIKEFEERAATLENERLLALGQIPNLPHDDVPHGTSEAENVVVREVGEKPSADVPLRDYLSLADGLNLIDTERAAKVSGSRFGYLLGDLVRLEFALGQLVFETVTSKTILEGIANANGLSVSSKPFVPVVPPVLVGAESMRGMGYLERGGDEVYYLPKDDLYLVGTSEQSIGPMHSDEIFSEEELPKRYVGFSTCFRREAGSYGKDTKGILRVHQFDKFEMFSFVAPETAREEHKLLLGIEEYLMQKLKLPYRVLNICTADLGDPAAAKFDIEVWLPGQNDGRGEYRETHSTSDTTDYQARRLNVRFKQQATDDKRYHYVHMLNGTAVAVGRMLIAIMESYQTKEGWIRIPEVLVPWVGKEMITPESGS